MRNVLLSGAAFVFPVGFKLSEGSSPIDLCIRESPIMVAVSTGQWEFCSF